MVVCASCFVCVLVCVCILHCHIATHVILFVRNSRLAILSQGKALPSFLKRIWNRERCSLSFIVSDYLHLMIRFMCVRVTIEGDWSWALAVQCMVCLHMISAEGFAL